MSPGAGARVLAADGRVLAEFFEEKRLPLDLEEIPLELRLAVIAVEDRRFRRHPGLDLIRNLGALLRDIQAGRLAQGGSTITQQLARNLFLTPEKTVTRKLREIFLALQIERRYTKDEILNCTSTGSTSEPGRTGWARLRKYISAKKSVS